MFVFWGGMAGYSDRVTLLYSYLMFSNKQQKAEKPDNLLSLLSFLCEIIRLPHPSLGDVCLISIAVVVVLSAARTSVYGMPRTIIVCGA